MASSPTEMSVFERVADRGSFSGAAEDMGLSASAAAKLISRLELRLGVGLIIARPGVRHLPPKTDLISSARGKYWELSIQQNYVRPRRAESSRQLSVLIMNSVDLRGWF
jgi:hypothetical protein